VSARGIAAIVLAAAGTGGALAPWGGDSAFAGFVTPVTQEFTDPALAWSAVLVPADVSDVADEGGPSTVATGRPPEAQGGGVPPVDVAPVPLAAEIPCSEESTYVSRASAAAAYFEVQAYQWLFTPSLGEENDILAFAAILLNFANSIDAIEPVPTGCAQVHDDLVASTRALYETVSSAFDVTTTAQFFAWLAAFERQTDEFFVAYEAWVLTAGLD
jgi:hypothetical protein